MFTEPIPLPKPFGYPIQKPGPDMTNIFAVKCSDGIVMCADTQSTGAGKKENAVKIVEVGKKALLGCAGYENNIGLLEDIVKRNIDDETRDYEKALVECNREYKREVYADWKTGEYEKGDSLPDKYYTEALFCASDARFELRIFKQTAPLRPVEITKPPYRISIGTGGFISNFVFKTIEDRIFSYAGMDWSKSTVIEVGQLAELIVYSVGMYDTYSNPQGHVWYLSAIDGKAHRFTREDLGFDKNERILPAFLKNIVANHPKELRKWFGVNIDNDLKDNLFRLFFSS